MLSPGTPLEVDEGSFEVEVLQRSLETPVIVDFWAEWCGPCRTLGPILEKVARDREGRVVVAKIDVDKAPALAAAFRIQSIPAVIAFRDGMAVDEFVGVLPESEILEFIDRLQPSEAELLCKEAAGLRETDPRRAEELYRAALASDERSDAARVGLAALLLKRGEDDEAEGLLENRLFTGAEEEEADRLRAILSLRRTAAEFGDEPAARARLQAEPADATRLYELGCILAAAEKYEEGLEHLFEAAKTDKTLGRGQVREAMVSVFQIIGVRSDLANAYRDKLAGVLY